MHFIFDKLWKQLSRTLRSVKCGAQVFLFTLKLIYTLKTSRGRSIVFP